jgi:hypothetical protein
VSEDDPTAGWDHTPAKLGGDLASQDEPRRRVTTAVERFMRVWGGHIMKAFKSLEDATKILDAGSPAQAATAARAAAFHLTDAALENDKGRPHKEIVFEIAAHFPTTTRGYPDIAVHPAFIEEIMKRLRVDRSTAIKYGNIYNGVAVEIESTNIHDRRPELGDPDAKFSPEVLELPPGIKPRETGLLDEADVDFGEELPEGSHDELPSSTE